MDGATLGKIIVGIGVSIAILGAVVWLLSRTGINFGNLPGDLRVEGEKSTFYFPVVTCIILSVVLTVVVNVLLRFFR